MADHAHQLYAVEFRAADQPRMAGFSCGDEPWSRHVAEWIRGSDSLESMTRGTRVWLFETEQGDVIGFGAVGTSQWQWPPPRGARTTIVLLPMLGVDVRFQGQPADPGWRYSRQLMSHLIADGQRIAREWAGDGEKPQWLVLLVHRDNARAIRFYERFGFELIPGVVRRKEHLIMKLWVGE